MTRSAAISIAILALVALALIMLLGRHGGHAANRSPSATSWRPWSIHARTRDTEDPKMRLKFERGWHAKDEWVRRIWRSHRPMRRNSWIDPVHHLRHKFQPGPFTTLDRGWLPGLHNWKRFSWNCPRTGRNLQCNQETPSPRNDLHSSASGTSRLFESVAEALLVRPASSLLYGEHQCTW